VESNVCYISGVKEFVIVVVWHFW